VCRWRRSRLAWRVHVRNPGAMPGFGIRPLEHDVRHQSAREIQATAAGPARDEEAAGAALVATISASCW